MFFHLELEQVQLGPNAGSAVLTSGQAGHAGRKASHVNSSRKGLWITHEIVSKTCPNCIFSV